MPNIPGVIGYTGPGAFTIVRTRAGSVAVPGRPTILAIMGDGQREEILVDRAVGSGADGLSAQFDSRLQPNGRYFQVASAPIVPGSFELFLNPQGDGTDLPLVRIETTTEGTAWADEFGAYGGYGAGTSTDGYGGITGAGTIDELDFGIDGFQSESDGTGFYDEGHGKRFGYTESLSAGTSEPQHYYLDDETGQIILDHALSARDRLVATYIGTEDINDPELFFDPDELYAKHGFPSVDNTLSLAAQMAWENGAGGIVAVQAGLTLNTTTGKYVTDPLWTDAFDALKKEDVDIIIPIQRTFIKEEILMPKYSDSEFGSLTGSGTFLQESVGGGDEPGINIFPLASSDGSTPDFLRVYHNGRELIRGIDYTVSNVAGPDPVRISFTSSFNGGTGALSFGDKVTADYRPELNLIATVQQVAKTHVELMSSVKQRKERTFFTGQYDGATRTFLLDDITGIDANFGDTFRSMFYVTGQTGIVTRVVSGETASLDAQYVAAAAAGLAASLTYLPEPLTRKTLIGFSIPRNEKFDPDEADLLGGDGAAIVEPLAAGGRIRHGLTTVNTGSAEEEEFSIVRIRDFIAKSSRELLENRFVGGVITPGTLNDVKVTLFGYLQSLVGQELITVFANISVKQDPIEPRQVNVFFDVQPVFPLNWIRIEFTIGVL